MIRGFLVLAGQEPQVVAETSWDADAICRHLSSSAFSCAILQHRAMAGAQLRIYHTDRPTLRASSALRVARPALALAYVDNEVVNLAVEDIFGLATALVAAEAGVSFTYPQPKELPDAQHS